MYFLYLHEFTEIKSKCSPKRKIKENILLIEITHWNKLKYKINSEKLTLKKVLMKTNKTKYKLKLKLKTKIKNSKL